MKKKNWLLGTIGGMDAALILIIGLGFAACGGGDDETPVTPPAHTHTYSTTWSSNATQHWKECTSADCDAKTGIGYHSPADGICETCGDNNTPGHTHTYSSEWTSDETEHWKECTGADCEAKTEIGYHSPADGICEICGDNNTPPHTHVYSTTWSSNATQHWKKCTGAGCDAITETANHAPADGVCTTCGYDTHTHTYSTTWSSNAMQHWKKCTGAGCDAKTETANHAPANDLCTTCGYDNTPIFPMQMVSIPAGTLTWGSATITLSAFKMGKYEVTQEQYEAVMGTNPSWFSSNPTVGEIQGKRPVEKVTWFDAIEFCNKLSTKEGLTPVYTITGRTPVTGYPITAATVTANWKNNGYRLPTEAQWEYACRAGSTTNWYFGDNESDIDYYAWYWDNSNEMTHQVGKKTANAWGLYDMHGNVMEWCWDWYRDYPTINQANYTGAVSGNYRVYRGGCWGYSASYASSAYRNGNHAGFVNESTYGFRVVRSGDDGCGGGMYTHTYVYKVTSTSYPAQSIPTCSCGETTDTTRDTIIGDTGPAGGIIFYINASGFTVTDTDSFKAYYLEAAPVNQGTLAWASIDFISTWVFYTKLTIGTGKANTARILEVDATAPAARACADYRGGGFSDWFLPSVDELKKLLEQRSLFGITPGGARFWSSSEEDAEWANYNYVFAAFGGSPEGASSNISRKSNNTENYVYTVRAF